MFDHESLVVYANEKFQHFKDANISIANTAFLYGLAVFTGMRAFKNNETGKLYCFRLSEHYKRMKNSAKILRFNKFAEHYSEDQFISIIKKLLLDNKIDQDAYIRATIYLKDNKISPKLIGYEDTFSVFLYPLGDYVPINGMRCKVSSWVRSRDNSIPSRAKITGLYANSAFAKTEALIAGFDETIFLNDKGYAIEGSAENLFIIRDGVLITPPVSDEILEGITRATVIEIAKDMGIPCVERSIARTELIIADEVFLTGTGAKVAPVVEIDNYIIGDGTPGPISKSLQKTYFDAVTGKLHQYRKWLDEV